MGISLCLCTVKKKYRIGLYSISVVIYKQKEQNMCIIHTVPVFLYSEQYPNEAIGNIL
jgi:hypothetical protein